VTTILITRHGETDWNAAGRWQGHSDTPLNERGREQARALAESLDGVDAVYASDLARARETAEILAERLGLDVHVDPRLRERGFGAWEGLTAGEIEERFADQHARWRAGEGFGAEDAEPFESLRERMREFLAEVVLRHPSGTVLVVTHGGSARVVYALASGLDYVRDHRLIPAIVNCGIARYAVRDGKLARLD
jgi:glucosyl-3-phosphoglycerate phosphatase